MGLYRERPGTLSGSHLGDALVFADTATLLLAFIRLRAYAYAHDRRLSDLAHDIVAPPAAAS